METVKVQFDKAVLSRDRFGILVCSQPLVIPVSDNLPPGQKVIYNYAPVCGFTIILSCFFSSLVHTIR